MRIVTLLMVLMGALLSGCASLGEPKGEPLRVGVMADYPPIIFVEDDGALAGLEVDFANQLGDALGRPVQFQQHSLAGLFAALQQGEIDIIMSGISITTERQQHFLFSLPYTTIGQMAVVRLEDAARLSAPGVLLRSDFRVGYKNGTTGETLVQSKTNQGVGFDSNAAAMEALITGEVDAYVHDAPTVWNLANNPKYRSGLLGLYKPLTSEQLAWVMAPENRLLKEQVDTVLKEWMNSGELMRLKHKWIPVKVLSGE
ncbi:transporter substrate-binding domain-containing protein [Alcanivorax sp. S6407]|uniref:substrate-binding periplasmic protein n=1 Tax=Alcanivorax sp. S6407 TaxID=2926424 RepID=UPI001FF2B307|nr:transporter substrate-binding domain-containing protein [Alcanivorax sp. S6407]MCK0154584.1 transporter substrate-binding domain-containing protein [Alcanivorax sp. S6407]